MITDTVRSHDFSAREAGTSISVRIRHLWRRFAAWAGACADQYAAAAMYDGLSRLSDAELSRRGLSRDTLARDCRAMD